MHQDHRAWRIPQRCRYSGMLAVMVLAACLVTGSRPYMCRASETRHMTNNVEVPNETVQPRVYPEPVRGNSGPSLYCFAVMRPHTTEHSLLNLQHDVLWGIFACEASEVFSSEEVIIGSSSSNLSRTTKVDTNLRCKRGGAFHRALNTNVFLLVWAAIADAGVWQLHDWTVKIDPDTVFFPDRLRKKLHGRADPNEGVYLSNCKYGLLGPLEALSRNATRNFLGHKQHCVDTLQKFCQGPCPFGEDMFIDKCLTLLKIQGIRAYDLILERDCGSTSWLTCGDPHKAGFHPFKTEKAFLQCLWQAVRASAAPAQKAAME